jgi:hypothetical protein
LIDGEQQNEATQMFDMLASVERLTWFDCVFFLWKFQGRKWVQTRIRQQTAMLLKIARIHRTPKILIKKKQKQLEAIRLLVVH